MPFKSEKQRRYFEMIAHNKNKAKKKTDLTPEVAEKFIHDSEGKVERFAKIKKKLKK